MTNGTRYRPFYICIRLSVNLGHSFFCEYVIPSLFRFGTSLRVIRRLKTCVMALAGSPRARDVLPPLLLSCLCFGACAPQAPPIITVWYGDEQTFGLPGNSQKYINILGHISSKTSLKATFYCINGGNNIPFQLGSDLHRLAKSGDFNIEFLRGLLPVGQSSLVITAIDSLGRTTKKNVTLHYSEGHTWPLPYILR